MTERAEMEAVIEAILFVANEPVKREKLLEVFTEREREAAAEAVEAVLERFREDAGRGVMVDEVAGGLRLVSRPELHGYLRRFFEVTGSNKLSMPALETLAIIAYRQPVTAPEIQELRSVNSAGVIKTLLERRLVRIAGRKEVVGKPFLYTTTREFLQHFGLRSLKELPPLEQFEEMFGGDGEGLAEPLPGPDREEQVDREVAELEERDDELAEAAETEAIEREREVGESDESNGPDSAAARDGAGSPDEGGEPEPPDPPARPEARGGSRKSDLSDSADLSDPSDSSPQPAPATVTAEETR